MNTTENEGFPFLEALAVGVAIFILAWLAMLAT